MSGAAARPSLWEGLRVLDVSSGIAGGYAARVFAGLGADVVKVETVRWPDPLRGLGADLGDGITTGFAACNAGKRSVLLDTDSAGGADALERLLAASDVLIDSAGTAQRAALRLGADEIAARHGHLVHASLSPFGDRGPYARDEADDIIIAALAGLMAVQGEQGREPMSTGTDAVAYLTGNAAVVGISAALLARDRSGRGQHVDVRALEVAVATQIFDTVAYSYTGVERPRRANDPAEPWAVLATRDGHIVVARSALQAWEELWLPVFGDAVPAWVLDPTIAARGDEVRAALSVLVATREKRELVELCQLLGHIVGEVLSIPEVLASPQHEARAFFDIVDYPSRRVHAPGPPVRLSATPWRTAADGVRRAPSRGEHTAEVLAELGDRPGRTAADSSAAAEPPLRGLRVLDFTMGWAGPYATELLADLGADVVKVESVTRTDWWRTARRMFTGGVDDPDWLWEASPLWNSVNESKRGITLDLTSQECRDIARRLASVADVVIENFTPRVMASFGLSSDAIRALNPQAVTVSMPGFGADGPWGAFRSTALVTEAMAGLTGRGGYLDGPPQVFQMSPADPNAGLVAAWAVLGAVRAGRYSREGQHIEVAQAEAMTHHLSYDLLEFQATGQEPPRRGNSVPGAAISGCWPASGVDEWVVVSTADPAAIARVAGSATPHALARFIAERDRRTAVAELRDGGVAAAPVQSAREVLADPHLAASGFFHHTDRAFVGEHPYPSAPFRLSTSRMLPRTPAPTLGADTRAVLADWLDVGPGAVDGLEARGLSGTEPRGSRDGKVLTP
ncbi:CoA transferase [Microbacterium sp. zg-Y818]|uniref:CaiB/BaiF CoA transferase family protein n=1 Tax=unclassified Microbacterium TaxID=2609290 RepID=UPI00214BD993|nr:MULTISPECIES: CoA transferase [unclassified Microbacterium]MCR2799341.1 CoA transferase [Microbacterium sp. zg.Y818]WIM21341.1 CoA transferase [Microbacterium sp. zg-Y818]